MLDPSLRAVQIAENVSVPPCNCGAVSRAVLNPHEDWNTDLDQSIDKDSIDYYLLKFDVHFEGISFGCSIEHIVCFFNLFELEVYIVRSRSARVMRNESVSTYSQYNSP